jgi:hypothetical protein
VADVAFGVDVLGVGTFAPPDEPVPAGSAGVAAVVVAGVAVAGVSVVVVFGVFVLVVFGVFGILVFGSVFPGAVAAGVAGSAEPPEDGVEIFAGRRDVVGAVPDEGAPDPFDTGAMEVGPDSDGAAPAVPLLPACFPICPGAGVAFAAGAASLRWISEPLIQMRAQPSTTNAIRQWIAEVVTGASPGEARKNLLKTTKSVSA